MLFLNMKTLKNSLIRNKPKDVEIGCVYSIPCNRCNKVYLGQTGKTCCKRITQHRYNVRTANESSGIFIHVRDEGHEINWKDTKTLYKSNNVVERLIIESCLIDEIPNMNLNPGFYKVDNIMKHILLKYPSVKKALEMVKPLV